MKLAEPMRVMPSFAGPMSPGCAFDTYVCSAEPRRVVLGGVRASSHGPLSSASTAATVSSSDAEQEDVLVEAQSPEAGAPQVSGTTAIVRNIPNRYTRAMLLAAFAQHGFAGSYDMVYLPHDLSSQMALGYAFVNFRSHDEAERFIREFNGFAAWGRKSGKVCSVAWSDTQGDLEAHVERYRSCAMMHDAVPDEFKPAIFNAGGERMPFPRPARRLRKPRAHLIQLWASARDKAREAPEILESEDCHDGGIGQP